MKSTQNRFYFYPCFFALLFSLWIPSYLEAQSELPFYSCPTASLNSELSKLIPKKWFALDSSSEEKGSIRRTVYNENGEPLAGADIFLRNTTQKAISDVAGQYHFDALEPRSYSISAMHINRSAACNSTSVDIEISNHYFGPNILLSRLEEEVAEKPIVYLYPERKQEARVKLDCDGILNHTFPKYDNEWKVTTLPDGTLYPSNERSYYALFSECVPHSALESLNRFLVKGSETIDFTEQKSALLGLRERETNAFILYWLPKLEINAYHFIHFSQDQYIHSCQLDVEPNPDAQIRIMMVYKPSKKSIAFEERILPPRPKRKGLKLVEWAGTLSTNTKTAYQ